MKTKSGHQNRFLRIITIPLRALGKARDFYVKSITNYADRGSCYGGSAMGMPPSTYGVSLPRSFSATSSRSNDSEDFAELMRAASTRSSLGENVTISLYMQQEMRQKQRQQQLSKGVGTQKMPPRSVSVGMGRIDEEKPCCAFGEEKNHLNKNHKLVYPRSRSYAVNKKSLIF